MNGALTELYYTASSAAEDMGNDLFFAAGTLLGQVRDGGWIEDDDDLDTAYVSRLQPKHARRELVEMGRILNARGYDTHVSTPMRTHLHVHHPTHHEARIDVFFYLDTDEGVIIPSGVASDGGLVADWQGVEPAEFSDIFGSRPKQFEELLAHVYGDDWRTPQTGADWHWGNRLKRSWPEYALTCEQVMEVEETREPGRRWTDECEKR